MADSPELLRLFATTGDQAAFAQVVSRHVNVVFSIALRQVAGDRHLAEDVTQQVFVALAQKARYVCEKPTLNGWLCVAATLTAAATVRGERRRRRRELTAALEMPTMDDHAVASEPNPGSWEAARPALDRAIAELNINEREAVLLRFFEGRSFSDVGRLLKVSEDGARMRVERALDKLRRKMRRHGMTSTAAAVAELLGQNATAMAAPAHLAEQITASALAAAAVSGTGVGAGFLTFMATTKTSLTLASLAALIAVGFAVHEAARWNQSVAELKTVSDHSRSLADKLQRLAAEARSFTSHVGSAAATTGAEKAPVGFSREQLNQNPQVHEALGKMVAWNIAEYFGPLLRSKGLSDEQVQRAGYLIGQLQQFGTGARVLSFKTDPRSDAQIDAELAQIVGEPWANLNSAYLVQRNVIDKLAGGVSAVDPLTAQQGTQLAQIWAAAIQSGAARSQAPDLAAISAQAQSVFTPGQYSALKALVGSQSGQALLR